MFKVGSWNKQGKMRVLSPSLLLFSFLRRLGHSGCRVVLRTVSKTSPVRTGAGKWYSAQFLLCCLSPPCFWVAEWGRLGWSLECAVRRGQSMDGNSWCDKTGEEVPSTFRVFFLSQPHQSSRDVASLWEAHGGSEVAGGCAVLVLSTCHQLLVSNPGSLRHWQSDKDALIVKRVCLCRLLTQSVSLLLSDPFKVTWQQNKKRAAQ